MKNKFILLSVLLLSGVNASYSREIEEKDIEILMNTILPDSDGDKDLSTYLFDLNRNGNMKGWEIRTVVNFQNAKEISTMFSKKSAIITNSIKKGKFYHGGNLNLWDVVSLIRSCGVNKITIEGLTDEGNRILLIQPK